MNRFCSRRSSEGETDLWIRAAAEVSVPQQAARGPVRTAAGPTGTNHRNSSGGFKPETGTR